jgi:hypothetical protein
MSAPLTSIGEQVRDVRPGLWGGDNDRQPTRRNLAAGTFAALVALLVGYSAPFTVYQTEQARWWCVWGNRSAWSRSRG